MAARKTRASFRLYYWIDDRKVIDRNDRKVAEKSGEDYRKRLNDRGMARFEVLGLDADRELIRSLARRLAKQDEGAPRIRASIGRSIRGEQPKEGGILAALRRSPLVGAELELTRTFEPGRNVDL